MPLEADRAAVAGDLDVSSGSAREPSPQSADRSGGTPAMTDPDASRSSGSSIKLYESMSNVPIRPGDVKKAGEDCISG